MKCKICNKETDIVFIVKRTKVYLCSSCSTEIFIQQARCYANKKSIFDLSKKHIKSPILYKEEACCVLNYLFITLLKKNKEYSLDNIPKKYLEDISTRVSEGHTVEQLKAVCYVKYKEWINDEEKRKYIRPTTLFSSSNFKKYIAELPEDFNPENNKTQRELIRKLNVFAIRGEKNEETSRLLKELISTGYNNQEFIKTFLN